MKGDIVGKLGRMHKRRNDDPGLFQMFWRSRQIKDTGTVKDIGRRKPLRLKQPKEEEGEGVSLCFWLSFSSTSF